MINVRGTTSIGMLGVGIMAASVVGGIASALSAIAAHNHILFGVILGSGCGTAIIGNLVGLRLYSRAEDIDFKIFMATRRVSDLFSSSDNL